MIVLPAPGVVRQQEPQAGLRQHVLVDGDPLVGQRVDQGDLGGERRVEQVAEGSRSPSATAGPPRGRRVKSRSGRASPAGRNSGSDTGADANAPASLAAGSTKVGMASLCRSPSGSR